MVACMERHGINDCGLRFSLSLFAILVFTLLHRIMGIWRMAIPIQIVSMPATFFRRTWYHNLSLLDTIPRENNDSYRYLAPSSKLSVSRCDQGNKSSVCVQAFSPAPVVLG